MRASIDGHPLAGSTATAPIILDPKHKSTLDVELANGRNDAVTVHRARVVGRSMGIRFFTYDYTLPTDVTVGAGETEL